MTKPRLTRRQSGAPRQLRWCLALAVLLGCSPENTPQGILPSALAAAATPTNLVVPLPLEPSLAKPTATPQEWEGSWQLKSTFAASNLTITPGRDGTFKFALSAYDGAHTGELSGSATIYQNTATFTGNAEETAGCRLRFELEGNIIRVEQLAGTCDAGVGVTYAGRYTKAAEFRQQAARVATMRSLGILTEPQDEALRRLVGPDYALFTGSSQLSDEAPDSTGTGATVHHSYVRGLASILENVVLTKHDAVLWAAVIQDDSILFYSTQPRQAALPLTRIQELLGDKTVRDKTPR
ncbi:hypothetical protein [Hymenobacter cellulosivorans]|uniref:Lipocalin-like domain-containing protein n=1 Tax=Hymenobacter cellulosivorans TaxID=2932249 RepID=A0ABY4F7Y9_9BACT|nr:hypothetical protein [Hymenobacter cellulosivorans]UOQ52034.1 hypothetical protein MUN80_20000 [Hymenobacter cellulosivorans]